MDENLTYSGQTPSGEVSPHGVPTVEEVSPHGVLTKPKRIDIKLPGSMGERIEHLRREDESDAAVVRRVIESVVPTLQHRISDLVTSNEHLQTTVGELEDDLASEQEQSTIQIDALKHRITGLEADLEKLIDAAPTTALTTPSEQSQLDFGGDVLKDTMDAVKDACADEEGCVKTALHLIDTKANLVNSQNSRDHDRDERDKDRKLKQDLADGKAKHEKDLALIKKGIVQEGDLEGVVFLGEHRHKSAKAAIEEQKEQARRESEEDEEWDALEGDVL